jgi:hypothetical protein
MALAALPSTVFRLVNLPAQVYRMPVMSMAMALMI